MRPSPPADLIAAEGLHSVQARILGALRAGLSDPERTGPGLFLATPGGTTATRWNIYREGYFLRLAEAIGNDYPAIERIAGRAAFAAICRRYLSEFPPSSHNIGKAGASLAVYLPDDPATRSLPFLPDLARFEWALAEALVARDVAPLSWSEVVTLGAKRFADAPLRARPGTAIVRSEWPLEDLRLAVDKEDEQIDIDLEGRPSTLLIWRHGLEPRWRAATEDEVAIVGSALSGTSGPRLLESGAFGTGQDAPSRLVAALCRVVELGILAPLEEEERT